MDATMEQEQAVALFSPQTAPVAMATQPAAQLMSSSMLLKSTMQQEVTEPEAGTADERGDSKYMLSTLFGERQAPPKTEDGGDTEEVDPALAMVFVRVHTPGSSMPGDGEQQLLQLKTGELQEDNNGVPLPGAAEGAAADGSEDAPCWHAPAVQLQHGNTNGSCDDDDAPVTSSLVIMQQLPLLPDAVLHACPPGPSDEADHGSRTPCVVVPASAADLPVQAVLDELDALLSRRPVSAQLLGSSRAVSGQQSTGSGLSRSNSLGALQDARGRSSSDVLDADEQQQQQQLQVEWCQHFRRRSSSQPPAVRRTSSGDGTQAAAEALPPEVRDAATSVSGLARPPSSSTSDTLQHLNNLLMPSTQHSPASSATGSFFAGRPTTAPTPPAAAAAAVTAAGNLSIAAGLASNSSSSPSREAVPAAGEPRAGPVRSPDRLAALYQRFLNDAAARRLGTAGNTATSTATSGGSSSIAASHQRRRTGCTPLRSSAPTKWSPDKTAAAAVVGSSGQERAQLYTHMSLLESSSRQPARQNSTRSSSSGYAQRAAAAAAAVQGSSRGGGSSAQDRGRSRAAAAPPSCSFTQPHGSSPVRQQRAVTPGAAPVAQLASPPHVSKRRAASSSPDKRTAAAHAAHFQQQHAAVTRSPGGVVLSQISFGQLLQETVVQCAMGHLEHGGSPAGRTDAWLLQCSGSNSPPPAASGPRTTPAGQPGAVAARMFSSMDSFRAAAALNPVPEDAALTISSANGSQDGLPAGAAAQAAERPACQAPPAAASEAAAPAPAGIGHSGSGRLACRPPALEVGSYAAGIEVPLLPATSPAAAAAAAAALQQLSACASRHAAATAERSPSSRRSTGSRRSSSTASEHRSAGPTLGPSASMRSHGSAATSTASGSSSSRAWRPGGRSDPKDDSKKLQAYESARRRAAALHQDAPTAAADDDGGASTEAMGPPAASARGRLLSPGCSSRSLRQSSSAPPSPGSHGGGGGSSPSKNPSAAASPRRGAGGVAVVVGPSTAPSSPRRHGSPSPSKTPSWRPAGAPTPAAPRSISPAPPRRRSSTSPAPVAVVASADRYLARGESTISARYGLSSPKSPGGMSRAASGLSHSAAASAVGAAHAAAPASTSLSLAALKLAPPQRCSSPPAASQQRRQQQQQPAHNVLAALVGPSCPAKLQATMHTLLQQQQHWQQRSPSPTAAGGGSARTSTSPSGWPKMAAQHARASYPSGAATAATVEEAIRAAQLALLEKQQQQQQLEQVRQLVASRRDRWIADAEAELEGAAAASPGTADELQRASVSISAEEQEQAGETRDCGDPAAPPAPKATAGKEAIPARGERSAAGSPPGHQQPRQSAPGSKSPPPVAKGKAAAAAAAPKAGSSPRKQKRAVSALEALLRVSPHASQVPGTEQSAETQQQHHHHQHLQPGSEQAGQRRQAGGARPASSNPTKALGDAQHSGAAAATALAARQPWSAVRRRSSSGLTGHQMLAQLRRQSEACAAEATDAALAVSEASGGDSAVTMARSASGQLQLDALIKAYSTLNKKNRSASEKAAAVAQLLEHIGAGPVQHRRLLTSLDAGGKAAAPLPAAPPAGIAVGGVVGGRSSSGSSEQAVPTEGAAEVVADAAPNQHHQHPRSPSREHNKQLDVLGRGLDGAGSSRDGPASPSSASTILLALKQDSLSSWQRVSPERQAAHASLLATPKHKHASSYAADLAALTTGAAGSSAHADRSHQQPNSPAAQASARPAAAAAAANSSSVPTSTPPCSAGTDGPSARPEQQQAVAAVCMRLSSTSSHAATTAAPIHARISCSSSVLSAPQQSAGAVRPQLLLRHSVTGRLVLDSTAAKGMTVARAVEWLRAGLQCSDAPLSGASPPSAGLLGGVAGMSSPKRRGPSRPCSPFAACFSPSAVRAMARSSDDEDGAAPAASSSPHVMQRSDSHSLRRQLHSSGGLSVAFEMDAAPCLVMVLQQPGGGAASAERLRVTGVCVLPTAGAGAGQHALDLVTEGGRCYTVELASQGDWAGLLAGLNAMLLLLEQASGEAAEQLGATAVEQATWSRAVQGIVE